MSAVARLSWLPLGLGLASSVGCVSAPVATMRAQRICGYPTHPFQSTVDAEYDYVRFYVLALMGDPANESCDDVIVSRGPDPGMDGRPARWKIVGCDTRLHMSVECERYDAEHKLVGVPEPVGLLCTGRGWPTVVRQDWTAFGVPPHSLNETMEAIAVTVHAARNLHPPAPGYRPDIGAFSLHFAHGRIEVEKYGAKYLSRVTCTSAADRTTCVPTLTPLREAGPEPG